MKNMITLHKTKFAPTPKALIDTLFTAGGTANGTFKRRKYDIIFYLPTGEPFAALVRLDKISPWFVSCSKHDGKLRFMHALAESDEAMLGIADLDQREVEAVIESIRSGPPI